MMRKTMMLLSLAVAVCVVSAVADEELQSNTASSTSHMHLLDTTVTCPSFKGSPITSAFPLMFRCALLSNIAYNLSSTPGVGVKAGNNIVVNGTSMTVQYTESYSGLLGFGADTAPWMIVSDASFIYVVFRGSTSPQDFLSDLRVAMSTFTVGVTPLGFVHNGFLSLYNIQNNVSAQVQSVVNRLPGRTLVFTGHSLGAALATLHGTAHQVRRGVTPDVYTFGCPRVGNSVLAASITSRTHHFRVKNKEDFVTNGPWTSPFLVPYCHGSDLGMKLTGVNVPGSRYICVSDPCGSASAGSPSDHSLASGYIPNLIAV